MTVTVVVLLLVAWYLVDRQVQRAPISVPVDAGVNPGVYVELVNHDCRRRGDDVHFTGTVENSHESRSLAAVRLRATLQTDGGRQLNTNWSYADSDQIPPDGRSTYSLWVDYAPGGTVCDIQVESARFTD